MKRSVLVAIAVAIGLLVVIGAAMAFMYIRPEPEWSSRSPEAIREFKAGLAAERKIYHNEAREHFQRALSLDPDFVMARLKIEEKSITPEKAKTLLNNIDQSKLNERERFLIRYALATLNRDREGAGKILDRYVREHPDDPVGLNRLCSQYWDTRDWDKAEKCYKHLLEVDPNWVSAQNNLGYIAMAQGQFREAEELFRTYRYIAPDQANPHDSLGELLTLIGRYPEAERSLNEAVKVRKDFCASYDHLQVIAVLEGDYDKATEILKRAEEAKCPADLIEALRCARDVFQQFGAGNWNKVAELGRENECYRKSGAVLVTAFAAALAAGRKEDADFLENWYRESRQKWFTPYYDIATDPTLLHLEGIRLAFEGKPREAAEKLRRADQNIVYWGNGQGIFKLYNRAILAELLEKTGRKADANQLLAEVNAVNPQILAQLEVDNLFR